MDVQFAFLNSQPDSPGALIRKLRDAFDRLAQFLPLQNHRIRMILWKHTLEIWKVPSQLAAQQQALAELKEQVIVVARERERSIRVRLLPQLQNLAHRLARKQRA